MKEKILEILRKTDGFVSGQKLCNEFQVSRTAVWKAVHQLQEEGYCIDAVRNKGYCLKKSDDLFTEAQFRKCLKTSWAGRDVCFLPQVDSTNNEIRKMAENGAPDGTVVIADMQTAGKGRRGSVFQSPRGCGIWMSLLLRPDIEPFAASMLTLVMGMAVRRAIAVLTSLNPKIKWPNDIVIDGKKLCGILTEMSMEMDRINYIVIGVGVNVQNEAFPDQLKDKAVSVRMAGGNVSRSELAAQILLEFEQYYDRFLQNRDLSALMEEYNRELINCGREVFVHSLKGDWKGTAEGINAEGSLIVRTDTGRQTVNSGEVSVRGIYGYV